MSTWSPDQVDATPVKSGQTEAHGCVDSPETKTLDIVMDQEGIMYPEQHLNKFMVGIALDIFLHTYNTKLL